MRITKIKYDVKTRITYAEDGDSKTLESNELPRPEFRTALESLALAYKTNLAIMLFGDKEQIERFLERNILLITGVTIDYTEEGTILCYKLQGHHQIKDTQWDTDVKLLCTFGEEGSPDKELLNLSKEAEMYIQCKRGEINLFEEE